VPNLKRKLIGSCSPSTFAKPSTVISCEKLFVFHALIKSVTTPRGLNCIDTLIGVWELPEICTGAKLKILPIRILFEKTLPAKLLMVRPVVLVFCAINVTSAVGTPFVKPIAETVPGVNTRLPSARAFEKIANTAMPAAP